MIGLREGGSTVSFSKKADKSFWNQLESNVWGAADSFATVKMCGIDQNLMILIEKMIAEFKTIIGSHPYNVRWIQKIVQNYEAHLYIEKNARNQKKRESWIISGSAGMIRSIKHRPWLRKEGMHWIAKSIKFSWGQVVVVVPRGKRL